ncbi:trimeric intracellular cation channel family protein [Alteromonas oceanisediminis]|uniref:trimeric intracellular cation channel family protein n=1 Tax=Alteromonas oceanisediminis TaxID=2836180 RepID=UPI001BD9D652|nr:trimeric intracellular cation channel family protein [Alteromonas oceanisediminis]MBT0587584.1 trimeric intracellular cation channel family protein [Alteromonas oceanisediminis]
MITLLFLFNIAATIAFAVSGALVAARHRLDWIGFVFMACITGIGGGTLRDTILNVPVFWLDDYHTILVCSASAILTYFAAKHISRRSKPLLWADALGMALFTALGAQKAMALGMNIPVATIMGVFSACLGGIIRDVIVNDVPVVFQREIYITASLSGALTYCLLHTYLPLNESVALVAGGSVAFTVRALAITQNLTMPAHQGLDD